MGYRCLNLKMRHRGGNWPHNLGFALLQGCGMMHSLSHRFTRIKLSAGWIASRICQGPNIYVWSIKGDAKEIHFFQQNSIGAFPLAGINQPWLCLLFMFMWGHWCFMLIYVEIYLVSRFGFVSLSVGFLGRDMQSVIKAKGPQLIVWRIEAARANLQVKRDYCDLAILIQTTEK